MGPLPRRRDYRPRRPATEHRAAYPHVCRAAFDGRLEVAAHPGRDPSAAGAEARTCSASCCSRAKAGRGSTLTRGDRHHPRSRSPSVLRTRSTSAGTASGGAPARPEPSEPAGSRSTCTSTSSPPVVALRADGQSAQQLGPVDRLHHRGVVGHRGRLVALQPADVVPGQVQVGALGRLGHGLLVPVLPHVPHPQPGQQPYVGGGEELRDHGEGDLVGAPARPCAGLRDPAAHRPQAFLELGAAVGHRASVPRASPRTLTRPPSRPERRPWRR